MMDDTPARLDALEREAAVMREQLARLVADLAERDTAERAMVEGMGPV